MKFILKNPAPLGANQRKWGDYHFGRCLAKYLERLGVEVETHYHGQWDRPNRADVVLVLRGKYPWRPEGRSLKLLWCISNPSTLSADEAEGYDALCLASHTHAETLRPRLAMPVHCLLQCTDPEEFSAIAPPPTGRSGFLFVGNSRGVRRPCVDWALEFGLDLQIYGRGWNDWGLGERVVADYVPNEDLPALYAASRLTLNDHWQDMKALGYVNNRIFDALAAGLPLLSDDFPELRAITDDALLYYHDRASFEQALTEALLAYPSVIARQQALWQRIGPDFSFARRAQSLYDLARDCLAARPRRRAAATTQPPVDPLVLAGADYVRRTLAAHPQRHWCPLCGRAHETPAAVFATTDPAAPCLGCGATAAQRALWRLLARHWDETPGLKQLLYLAPEEPLARLLHQRPDINYLSGDAQMPNVLVRLDPERLDFPAGRFHLIVAPAVGHQVDSHPDTVAAELWRVTRPKGLLFTLDADGAFAAALRRAGWGLETSCADTPEASALGLGNTAVLLARRLSPD